jgi:choline-sulfatase
MKKTPLFFLVGLAASACAGSAPRSTAVAPAPSAAPPAAPPAASAEPAAVADAGATTTEAAAAPKPTESPHGPWNVVLISIDSLRADMPWAGYPRPIAPRLTELEKRSVSYTHAYSISSFTSKSVGGLLGGTYPSAMKRDGEFFTRYYAANVMFPEILQAAGIHTLAGHAHAYLDKGHGFEQGFDDYRVVPGITFDYNKDPYITSQKLTPLAIDMLGKAAEKPGRFFAWFHYMDPHDVYQPHPEQPQFGTKARDLYDGEVLYTDGWVGKLVDFIEAQPWGKKTAVIITADHGEAFGEHNLHRHAFELYDVLVHVPMFFLVPGVAPRHIDVPRSHVDLAPTILDLLGVPKSSELRGESLVPEVVEAHDEPPRPVVCDLPDDSFNERRRALIEGSSKIIALANDYRYEIYDLDKDPGELDNLVKKDPDRAKAMIARYKEISRTIVEEPVKGGIHKHKD